MGNIIQEHIDLGQFDLLLDDLVLGPGSIAR